MSECGFNNIFNVKHLDAIFKFLVLYYQIDQYKEPILPDNVVDIEEIKYHQSFLTKPFNKFVNKKYDFWNKMIFQSEYNQKLEWQQRLKNEEQERLLKQQKENDLIKKEIEKEKQKYGNKWRDTNWIENNIGIYYTETLAYEYFWTIIGSNYKIGSNENVYVQKNILKQIENMKFCSLRGKIFIMRKFHKKDSTRSLMIQVYDEEKAILVQQAIQSECHYGVYGMYKNDELFYIGSTMRNFSIRFKEHLDNISKNSNELYVYSQINKNDKISFKILIDANDVKTEERLNRRDIESMELGLIHLYQPQGNLGGRILNFKRKK